MSVTQISLSMKNIPGQLLKISDHLRAEGINIRGISLTDSSDSSTVRFVTDNPVKTINVLRSHGYVVKESEAIAVEVPDHPGGLAAVLKPLYSANINVLYLYPYLGRGESSQAIVIVEVDKTQEAIEVLERNWVKTYGKEIYAL
jgi:hypothetical protein